MAARNGRTVAPALHDFHLNVRNLNRNGPIFRFQIAWENDMMQSPMKFGHYLQSWLLAIYNLLTKLITILVLNLTELYR